MKLMLLILMLALPSLGADLPSNFVRAIHQVESSGQYTNVKKGDKGKAIGPLQIHESYWKDSRVSGQYQNCEDYNYSVRVMTAYLNRYGKRFIISNDFQALARIHNGGPRGYEDPKTLAYWRKVQKHL